VKDILVSLDPDSHIKPIVAESDPERELYWWHPFKHQQDPARVNFIGEEHTIFKREPAEGEQKPDQLSFKSGKRLHDDDQEKDKKAWEQAQASGVTPNSAHFVEEYLTAYFEIPVKVWEISVGIRGGYPIRSYGFVSGK